MENLSKLCEMIVCGSQTSGALNRRRGFQHIGLPIPVSQLENSAESNKIHTIHRKSVNTACMVLNPSLQNIRPLPDLLNCTKSHLRNSEGLRGQCQTLIGFERVPIQKIEQLIPNTNCCLTTAIKVFFLVIMTDCVI